MAGGCPASLRPGGRWLDLYSGTGSVGIEAISRGCSEVFLTFKCTSHYVKFRFSLVRILLLSCIIS